MTNPGVCSFFMVLRGSTDQPQACSVIPPQQEPGAQAPAPDPHHDASQRSAPTHSNPPSGTGKRQSLLTVYQYVHLSKTNLDKNEQENYTRHTVILCCLSSPPPPSLLPNLSCPVWKNDDKANKKKIKSLRAKGEKNLGKNLLIVECCFLGGTISVW